VVSHRRTPHARTALAARVTVFSAAATAAAAMTAVPVAAAPAPPGGSAEAAAEVDRLFADAERAVEEYNAGSERVAELEAELDRQRDRVARGQQAVNEHRHTLGRAAAAHYRAGGMDPTLALMLSDDPDSYLNRAATLDRANHRQAGELADLVAAQRTLDQRRQEAEEHLAELTEERERLARAKRTAQRKLASAQRQYERLLAEERAARDAERRAAATPPPSGEQPAGDGVPASGRAAAAVAAARRVVGAPYAWGQAGPDAFDCSGLIQWAYAQAGVALPRTSQAQAGAGRRVPADEARPGDIVVYRADASHVALYVGGGQVVHAPHPGARVRYDPVGMMPVTGVVRP
jgi:cell wall-associated NlpC family hydrolase